MESVREANKNLKAAHDDREHLYKCRVDALLAEENKLKKRFEELDKLKQESVDAFGVEATDCDRIEINAGGKIFSVRRGALTLLKGTMLEKLFSGRWDKKLLKDADGRFFLDLNPLCFRAIVDYLNVMAISCDDNSPDPPSVELEYEHILHNQLEVFGINDFLQKPIGKIAKTLNQRRLLRKWTEKDCPNASFHLLHRGLAKDRFNKGMKEAYQKYSDSGCGILTVFETEKCPPLIFGVHFFSETEKFLFCLGRDDTTSSKMQLVQTPRIYDSEETSFIDFSNAYKSSDPETENLKGDKRIKTMEIFLVVPEQEQINWPVDNSDDDAPEPLSFTCETDILSRRIDDALNMKLKALKEAEQLVSIQENSFEEEKRLINLFASGSTNDIVLLNVSGTPMHTKRSSLRAIEDSALARQFDDSLWTEQGTRSRLVKEWTHQDVLSWINGIGGVSEGVVNIFHENQINGREMLALKKDGLKDLGIDRIGTIYFLLDEICKLKETNDEVLVDHSPYCFGKILDYLRLKHLHSCGFIDEPDLPTVSESKKDMFERVVSYYFPGDASRYILG